jgi:hypothetical protein
LAPEWWRDNQAKWRAIKSKSQNSNLTNYFFLLVTLWVNHGDSNSCIILDSGSLADIFNHCNFFSKLEMGSFDVLKTGKAKATLPVVGKGTVVLCWKNTTVALEDCLFVPDIVINLVSAGALVKKGCSINALTDKFTVKRNNMTVMTGNISGNLFTVDNPTKIGSDHSANLVEKPQSLQEIDEMYGHASISRLLSLILASISAEERNRFECKSCISAKITKSPFNGFSTLTSKPFECIHLDLIGPITPQS